MVEKNLRATDTKMVFGVIKCEDKIQPTPVDLWKFKRLFKTPFQLDKFPVCVCRYFIEAYKLKNNVISYHVAFIDFGCASGRSKLAPCIHTTRFSSVSDAILKTRKLPHVLHLHTNTYTQVYKTGFFALHHSRLMVEGLKKCTVEQLLLHFFTIYHQLQTANCYMGLVWIEF